MLELQNYSTFSLFICVWSLVFSSLSLSRLSLLHARKFLTMLVQLSCRRSESRNWIPMRELPFSDTTTGSDAWRAFKSTVLFTGCVACFSSSFPELDLLDAKEGLPFLPFGDFPPFFSLLAFFKSSRGMRAFRSKISYLACRAANASSEMSSSRIVSIVCRRRGAESTLFLAPFLRRHGKRRHFPTDGVLMSRKCARRTSHE